MDQQRLALREAGPEEDVGIHRAHRLGQRGGLDEGRALRSGQELAGGDGDLLGVAAAGEQCAYRVTGLPAGHVRADRGDRARALKAGIRRGALRRRVVPLALHHVRAVHRGCGHVDENLVRSGHRIRDLGPLENLRTAGFGDDHRVHRYLLARERQ